MATTIAVTGKGGVGKTTLAALIVRHLSEHADGPILALDADPDCNLATVLGIEVETTIGDLREEVLQMIKDFPPGMSKENYVEAGLHQIIAETPKVDLITMGRAEGPGCYCFINNLLRKFSEELTPSYRWMVMDNEAGLEHLSRGTTAKIDHLIVVVNEDPLAIDCAARVDRLLGEISRDVRSKHYVINTVRPDREQTVRDRMAGLSLDHLGSIPRDDAVEDVIFHRESIYTLKDSPVPGIVAEMMRKIGAG